MIDYPGNVIPTYRFQYCPMCREPLKQEALYADGISRLHCSECGWIQLVTNCICVAVVVHYGEAVVAIHTPDGEGVGFPAGIVEYGEDPSESAVREVREETGLVVEIVRDLGWSFVQNNQFPGPTLYLLFEAEVVGGELRGGDEGPVQVYTLADLPEISKKRHGSYIALQRYLEQIMKE